MNRQVFKCCPPKKKRKRRNCNNKKIGISMLVLGTVIIFLLALPLKYWVLLLCFALMLFGILLIKK